MLDIGSTNFIINVPSLPKKEFEKYSTRLFDNWVEDVKNSITIPDFAMSMEIEEGSIRGAGKIAATLGVLYLGIGQYGDFVSGLETIKSQVTYVSERLYNNARSPFGGSNANSQVKRSGGAISRLQSLFNKVQRRELSADEALVQAISFLGEEAEKNPDFIKELHKQFMDAPKYYEQISFLEESEDIGEIPSDKKKPRSKRAPKEVAIPNKFRIEIWKESKKDKRHIKIIDL